MKEGRATSVSHVEYEILGELIESVDIESLHEIMVDDTIPCSHLSENIHVVYFGGICK